MKLVKYLSAGIALSFAMSAVQAADVDPKKAVKYRKSAFHTISWQMGPMAAMAKGEMPFDQALFAKKAETLAFLSQLPMEGFVPETKDIESEAKPALWDNMDDFKAKMEDFQKAADALVVAAKGGDEGSTKEHFGKMAKTCKACHKEYKTD